MKILFPPPDIGFMETEQGVLHSGCITTGPKTKVLERQVAKFCEVNRSVCHGSQTACAEMILLLLGVGYGDQVIAV